MDIAEVADSAATQRLGPDRDVGRSAGTLVVAWQHPERRAVSPVGLLSHGPGTGYRFVYLRRAAAVDGFRPFLGFPELERVYESRRLFPMFSQRVMSPMRPDRGRFLAQLDLGEDASPWEQLARSEGRSSGDTVQLFPVPTVQANGSASCLFLVHGIRHVTNGALPPLARGDRLGLLDEPSNPVNPAAALVCTLRSERIGYVPDLLVAFVRDLQRVKPVELSVEHVNGPEAPMHLRVLVKLRGTAPPGYEPMTGPEWEPFAGS